MPVDLIGWTEYTNLTNKTSEGPPSQVCYRPILTDGKLYVWQEPDDMKDRLKMTIKRPVSDFDAAPDNAEFPVEWLEPIKFNLALRLAPEYGKRVSQNIKDIAKSTYDSAANLDRGMTSAFLQPDDEGMGRY
jgi:hypothetical protein